jgi:hypothetical protein
LFGVHNLYIHTKFDINPSMWSNWDRVAIVRGLPAIIDCYEQIGLGLWLDCNACIRAFC